MLLGFPMKQNIGYGIIRENVSPFPADNAFAGRGLLVGGSSCTLWEKDLFLNFTKHNGSSCRNVKFYKTLAIEFLRVLLIAFYKICGIITMP